MLWSALRGAGRGLRPHGPLRGPQSHWVNSQDVLKGCCDVHLFAQLASRRSCLSPGSERSERRRARSARQRCGRASGRPGASPGPAPQSPWPRPVGSTRQRTLHQPLDDPSMSTQPARRPRSGQADRAPARHRITERSDACLITPSPSPTFTERAGSPSRQTTRPRPPSGFRGLCDVELSRYLLVRADFMSSRSAATRS